MAELSQIEKDSVVYDLKDTTARAEADKKIQKPLTAAVGDFLVVTEVDENGAPVAFEAAAPPGDWELIYDVTLEESISSYDITLDKDGNPFCMKEMYYYLHMPATETPGYLRFVFNGFKDGVLNIGRADVGFATSGSGDKSSVYELGVRFAVAKDNSFVRVDGWSRKNVYQGFDGGSLNGLALSGGSCTQGGIVSIHHFAGVVLPAGTVIKIYKVR